MTYYPLERSDENTILQHTSVSSSLCTDDTQALLQVNAISQRVAIAKRELSSSSSGTSKYGSCDLMRTPSPRRHSSSFTPLLMSTPHPAAKSRLEGVANSRGVAEEVESISSISSEVGVASTEVCNTIISISHFESRISSWQVASHLSSLLYSTSCYCS